MSKRMNLEVRLLLLILTFAGVLYVASLYGQSKISTAMFEPCSSATFASPNNYSVGTSPRYIASRDFNNDGLPDLVTANRNVSFSPANQVSVLINNGAGGFLPGKHLAVGANMQPRFVTVADVNTDGNADLAVASETSLANNISIFLGDGAGNFAAPRQLAAGSQPRAIGIADFNSDGKPDLAIANHGTNPAPGSTVSIHLGNGDGTFLSPVHHNVGLQPVSIAVGDLNTDGKLDLAVANESTTSNNVSLLFGDGGGNFSAALNLPVGAAPASVSLGDFNGDTKPDVVTANRGSGNVSLLINDGAGGFNVAINFASGNAPNSVAVGDFNGDGFLDLVVANETTNRASVLLGNGTGSLSAPKPFTAGTAPSAVTVSDFNADTRPDFAVSNATTSNALVFINTCSSADLTLTKSHAGNFSANNNGVYALTVRNVGTAASSGTITVKDVLPAGLTFVSGSGESWACTAISQEVTCTSDEPIAVNGTSVISLVVNVALRAAPSVTNTANVLNGSDINPANNSASDSTTVNLPPVAEEQTVTTGEDTTQAITLVAADAEGASVVYSVVTQPAHGSLSGAVPNLMYTPAADFNGSDSFTFKANDGQADSNTATITISVTPVNDSPVANEDNYALDEDNALNASVIPNDADADGDTLTATLASDVTHGTLNLNSNGSFTYMPVENFNGSDSFTYKLNDGVVDSGIATVVFTINPVNDAPVAENQSIAVEEDSQQNVLVEANDLEGSALTYSIVSPPTNGVLSGVAPNFSYTPANNYNGPDTFTFKVNDGQTDSNHAVVFLTVTPVNDAPAAVNDSYTTNANSTLDIGPAGVLANDSDVDGNGLSASRIAGPSHGTLNLNANGSFSYTPEAGYSGPDGFSYAAADGVLSSNPATVVITVNPVADVAITKTDSADPIAVGATYSYTLTVTNNGPSTATGVVVTDTLPSSLIFVSANATQGTCSGPPNINCNLETIESGATATVTVDVTPSMAGSISNTASVTATEADSSLDNNSATETTTAIVSECTTANFAAPTNFTVGSQPRAAVLADFNGDNKIDVAVANRNTNNVSILLGNGAGGFVAALNVAVISTPQSLVVGDFNEDGKLDLAVANRNSSLVSLLLGNGAGGFSAAGSFPVATQPVAIGAADFNGDTHLDLVTANEATGANNVSVLLGNGAGIFANAVNFPAGPGPSSIAVADYNGDNQVDLAVTNFKANNVSILHGNGAGAFSSPVNFPAGTGPTFVIASDFNADGKPDLAIANETSNNFSVLLRTATGFAAPVNYPAGAGPRSISLGDFNEDGRVDLVIANRLSNNVSIFEGNGTGVFSAANTFPTGTQPFFVVSDDFNRDSRPDLLTVNASSNNVSVLINACSAADLALTKTHTGDFQVGTNGSYTLAITNIGAGSTFGTTTVTDTLPAGLSYVSATGTGWTCSVSGQTVTCSSNDSLAIGATSEIALTVTAGVTAAPSVTNSATLSNPADVNSANNTANDFTVVKAATDLALVKTASSDRLAVNNNLVYTITVTNNGPSAATNVVVTDPLPAGITFVSASSTKGTCSGSSTVVCNVGSLALNAAAKITITVTATTEGTLTNTATVTGNEIDPDAANNSSTSETTIGSGADLSVNIAGTPDPVATGTNLTYTINVGNNGEAASSVVVTDILPAQLTFVSCTATGGVCGGSGNNRTITYSSLASGATATITLVATVRTNVANNSSFANAVTVTSNTADPNASNNTASTTVTAVAPIVSVNPATIDFGNQIVTTTSAAQIITVTNTGAATLIFSGVTLTGLHPTHFAIASNTCPGAGVVPNASCTVGVKFTPGVIGNRSAILSLQNNAGNSPQGVQLLGHGTETTAAAFGVNNSGQLGNGLTVNSPNAVQVSSLNAGIVFSGGTSHSLAMKPDGTVWAWGANSNGQLGINSTVRSLVPVQTSSLTGVIRIAAGSNHNLALKADGTVWAWGANNAGQIGDNSTVTRRLVPVRVSGLTDVVAIAARGDHSIALKSDGTVWGWGENTYGQVGDGTSTKRLVPVRVTGLTTITAIAAGSQHSLALKTDGTVMAWGANTNGQLGDGTSTKRLTPVTVTGLNNVIAISAGTNHSLALKSDNSAYGWGANNNGQLGNGTTTKSMVAIQTSTGPFKAIAAGANHSLALRTDGTVFGTGLNTAGQLGNGSTTNSLRFTQAVNLLNIAVIAAGDNHSLAAAP